MVTQTQEPRMRHTQVPISMYMWEQRAMHRNYVDRCKDEGKIKLESRKQSMRFCSCVTQIGQLSL